jgi:DNA-binding FrmR family transcriptional regulator
MSAPDINPETRRKVINRLRRASGQLNGAIKALEGETDDCRAVVLQLAAISEAVKRAGFVVVASGMRHCLDNQDSDAESETTIEELEKLFLALT